MGSVPIAQEDVVVIARVTWGQVGRGRTERDISAVGADRRLPAVAIAFRAIVGLADAIHASPLAVVHEYVALAVGVVRDQGRGLRMERHVSAVGADGGTEAIVVALRAVPGHTDALHLALLEVEDEDVVLVVHVAVHQVRGP